MGKQLMQQVYIERTRTYLGRDEPEGSHHTLGKLMFAWTLLAQVSTIPKLLLILQGAM